MNHSSLSKVGYRKTFSGVVSLSSLKAGESGVIKSLSLEDSLQLERLKSLGLVSGARLFIERDFPVLSVRLEFSHIFMDKELAEKIFVFPFRQH
ncbi:MAG: FeoA family protein [Bacillota bacterium]|nr:FeoA family protein [Bacillota bacterium]